LTSGGVSTLHGVVFTNNTAGRFGGGARLLAAVIEHSTFSGNSAASEGGAVLLFNSSDVFASTFNGNQASLSGGVSMQGSVDRLQNLRVFNSLFYDNLATSTAGAADMRLFDLTITLANNTYGRAGAAAQNSVAFFRSNLNIENNIWNNYQASMLIGQTAVGTTLNVDYNLYFNAPLNASIPGGAHDLTADPQFANPAAADFKLLGSSPAIDSGDTTVLPASILADLAFLPRFMNAPAVPDTGVGNPPLDRGALEFIPAPGYLPAVFKQ
jgi:hypothetical protein